MSPADTLLESQETQETNKRINKKDLLRKLEREREILNWLAAEKDLSSEELLNQSKKIDRLINCWYRFKTGMSN
jgi:hypothetical protein